MSHLRYDVDSNLVIRIWDDEGSDGTQPPFLVQDVKPTGQNWSSREEAVEWAEEYIANTIIGKEAIATREAEAALAASEEQPQE